MATRTAFRRNGMTLVELLVVVVILLVLAVTVLPSIAGTAESRRSREAARIVSGFIAKARSLSIGRQQWSGFTIVPVSNTSDAALEIFLADVPDAYRGDFTTTTLSGSLTPTATGTIWTGTAPMVNLVSGTSFVRAGDLIRLDGRGPHFQLSTITLGTATGTVSFQLRTATSSLLDNAGQNAHNTPWPMPGIPHTFEICPQPVQSGSPLTIPENRCIDLFYFGHGSSAAYTTFGAAFRGSRVSILFDGTGQLRQVVTTSSAGVVSRFAVTGPVFLLIGRTDRAGQSYGSTASATNDTAGANWQYPESIWIAIDPATGSAKSANCTVTASATTALLSQAWIRQVLLSTSQ
jgi:prepilin-type N-terminal cleavage/methylation domain-containing protein